METNMVNTQVQLIPVLQPNLFLPLKKDLWTGRGYPVYDKDNILIGYHPGCELCDQYGFLLKPEYGYNAEGHYVQLHHTTECPNCKGHAWADWVVPYNFW